MNLSDSTYGWHGYRSGLSLYYYHTSQPQTETQEGYHVFFMTLFSSFIICTKSSELSLTSEMTLAVDLMLSKTTLLGEQSSTKLWITLGKPYTHCTNEAEASHCYRRLSRFRIFRIFIFTKAFCPWYEFYCSLQIFESATQRPKKEF